MLQPDCGDDDGHDQHHGDGDHALHRGQRRLHRHRGVKPLLGPHVLLLSRHELCIIQISILVLIKEDTSLYVRKIKVNEYFVVLLENAVHNRNDLLEVHLHGPVTRMMFVRSQVMISVIILVVVFVVLLHVGDSLEKLQPVQPVVVVCVVFPEVLHQQPRVVHVGDVILHVVLLHLLLDVPELFTHIYWWNFLKYVSLLSLPVKIDINVLVVHSPLSSFRWWSSALIGLRGGRRRAPVTWLCWWWR